MTIYKGTVLEDYQEYDLKEGVNVRIVDKDNWCVTYPDSMTFMKLIDIIEKNPITIHTTRRNYYIFNKKEEVLFDDIFNFINIKFSYKINYNDKNKIVYDCITDDKFKELTELCFTSITNKHTIILKLPKMNTSYICNVLSYEILRQDNGFHDVLIEFIPYNKFTTDD